jgi:hypothetical protein
MAGFLQSNQGFLAPTGFTNYLQQYSGAYPVSPFGGVRSMGGGDSGGGLPIGGSPAGSQSFGVTQNAPNLSMQQQYGGPMLNKLLSDLVMGIGGMNKQNARPLGAPNTTTTTIPPASQQQINGLK